MASDPNEEEILNEAWRVLVAFEFKSEEPCDDLTCESCYVQK